MRSLLVFAFLACLLAATASGDVGGISEYLAVPQGLVTGNAYEIPNMPPVKDQNGVGLCYGFASSTVVEQYLCRVKKCTAYSNSNLISPIFISHLSEGSPAVVSGGDPSMILASLSDGMELRKEECSPFAPLSKFIRANGGWKAAEERFKRRTNCESCPLNFELPSAYFERTQRALKQASFETFLWELFATDGCRANSAITLPKLNIGSMRITNGAGDQALAKVESLLLNGIPVQANICFAWDGPFCDRGHALVLSGIKEVCDPGGECVPMLKVHNSYGKSWQEGFDGGWVQASALMAGMYGINWIEKPNEVIPAKRLTASRHAEPAEEPVVRKPAKKKSTSSNQWKPGEDRGEFIDRCYASGGQPSFNNVGIRCVY